MCKLFNFLYRLIPVSTFRFFLIRRHFSNCSCCQEGIKVESLLKKILVTPDCVKSEESLWPLIRPKLYTLRKNGHKMGKKPERHFQKKWRWAVAGVVVAVMIGANFLIYQYYSKRTSQKEIPLTKGNPRILIKFSEFRGKKVRPYIYQTPDISFIWFSEKKNSGG